MKLGVVEITNLKDGNQNGRYTSLSDRQIMTDTNIEFHTNSFRKIMREDTVANKYPE